MKKDINGAQVATMQIREEGTLARRTAARMDDKDKRKVARATAERAGLVAKQDTSQRGAMTEATRTSLPLMKMRVKTLKKHLSMTKRCMRGFLLEDSENEQWQEVISRRDKQKVNKAYQASQMSVE